jgi:nitroreductase
VELDEAMRTQNACRLYRDDPVADEVLYRAVELARFAPTGGNRGPVRFVFVRDPALRAQLGEWYLPLARDLAAARAAKKAPPKASAVTDPDDFGARFGSHPMIIVVCVDLGLVHATDTGLNRLSIVGGASVYPMVQNLCLALRAQGVGTALTTLLVHREPDVKRLLRIPDFMSTACHITAGYPVRPFPSKLRRPDPSCMAFTDHFGVRLAVRPPSIATTQPEASQARKIRSPA